MIRYVIRDFNSTSLLNTTTIPPPWDLPWRGGGDLCVRQDQQDDPDRRLVWVTGAARQGDRPSWAVLCWLEGAWGGRHRGRGLCSPLWGKLLVPQGLPFKPGQIYTGTWMPVLSMCKRNDRIMTVVGTLVVIIISLKKTKSWWYVLGGYSMATFFNAVIVRIFLTYSLLYLTHMPLYVIPPYQPALKT